MAAIDLLKDSEWLGIVEVKEEKYPNLIGDIEGGTGN